MSGYGGPPPTGRYGAPPRVPMVWAAPTRPPAPFGLPGQVPAPAPGRRPVTPAGAPPYDTPQPYLRLTRARDWAWWRPLLK